MNDLGALLLTPTPLGMSLLALVLLVGGFALVVLVALAAYARMAASSFSAKHPSVLLLKHSRMEDLSVDSLILILLIGLMAISAALSGDI